MIKIYGFSSDKTEAYYRTPTGKLVSMSKGQELTLDEFGSAIVRNGSIRYTVGNDPKILELGSSPKSVDKPAEKPIQPPVEAKKVITEKDSSVNSLVAQAKAAVAKKK